MKMTIKIAGVFLIFALLTSCVAATENKDLPTREEIIDFIAGIPVSDNYIITVFNTVEDKQLAWNCDIWEDKNGNQILSVYYVDRDSAKGYGSIYFNELGEEISMRGVEVEPEPVKHYVGKDVSEEPTPVEEYTPVEEPTPVEPTPVEPTPVETTTKLISSLSLVVSGQPVTLTAIVDAMSQGTENPSGIVTFMDGTTQIGSDKLSSRQATLTISSLSVESHAITAEYSGDDNFESSTSPAIVLTVQQSNPEPEPTTPKIESSIPNEENSYEHPYIIEIKQSLWEHPIVSAVVSACILALFGFIFKVFSLFIPR